MTTLYEEIKEECTECGWKEGNKCLYNRFYECKEHMCPLHDGFCGRRPADLLVERYNLKEQFEKEMLG